MTFCRRHCRTSDCIE